MQRITQAVAAGQHAASSSNQLGAFLETVVLVLCVGAVIVAAVIGGARLLARSDVHVTHEGTVQHVVSGTVTHEHRGTVEHVGTVQHVGTVNHVVELNQGDRERLDRLAAAGDDWPPYLPGAGAAPAQLSRPRLVIDQSGRPALPSSGEVYR
jgi:hypothetical protein